VSDDFVDRFPLRAEGPEAILARMQADLNAGIDPADPLYADIVPGSVWDDMARADALEMDRVYDRMLTEVPAAALPATATGEWLDLWADLVDLARKPATPASGTVTFAGTDGTAIITGVQVSTEAPTPDADPVTFQTTASGTIAGGSVDLPVQALDDGSQGNVPANAITILDSAIDGVTVTNATAITGASDVESDEALQGRVRRKLKGTNGAGNVDYYVNVALNYPGVGFVTVQPNTPSIGHVTVMISDVNGDPAPPAMINGLQAQLDPSADAGQGAGLAAPGATVIVTTPGSTAVAVAATIAPASGYSLTGTAGTKALTGPITDAVDHYFATLGVGDDVIHNKVLAAIIDVDGVLDVSALTLNGGGGNVAIDATHTAALTLPLTLT
jgi:uncharacterized phage protein gp47/JayE